MDILSLLDERGCADFIGDPATGKTFYAVIGTVRTVVQILQIVVPVALILLGSIDIGKAVIAGDEKKIKEAQKPFIKRVIAAVIVFLIPWIVGIVLSLVGGTKWQNCWNNNNKTIKDVTNGSRDPLDPSSSTTTP